MKQNPEKKFKNTVEMTVASIDVISKEPKRLGNLLQILNTLILCCVILFSSPSLTSIYGFESTKPEIGMNIYSCRYFSSQIMFVDAMKSAMPWITNNIIQNKISESVWDTGHIEKIKKTENGYPTHLPVQISDVSHPQTVATLMMRGLEGNYPSGLYHVFYDGIGRLQFGFDAKIVKEEYGKITIKVKPSNNGIYLKILKSDKNAPVRNIRVILPGFENTYKDQPFYPAFVERLHFCKVLRFMDTARTNNSKLIKWKNRTKPDYYTQDLDTGLAYEYMIDLANTMNISPWFCIPHLADKNFIQQFAILIKNRLKPDLKLYIEYSNEIWNNQFAQSKYAKKTGCEKKLYYDCNDKTNQKGNQFWSGIYFQAKKSAEIFKIFEEELENKIDLIKILSGQAVSPKVQDKLLSAFNSPEINPHGIKADAIAIAPYIGWEIANIIVKNNEIDSITEDKIFQYLEDSLSEMEKAVKNNKIIADKFNVSLFSYEAGQHLAAAGVHMKNKVLTQKLHNANRDFRMKAIYDKMLNIWFDNEGELFVPYTYVKKYGKYGAWGLLEYQDQPIEKAYKYQAIQEYSKKN